MEQTVLTRENLNEATVRHYRTNGALVYFTNLRDSYYCLDLGKGSIDRILVRSRNLHLAYAVSLFDGDSSACLILHLLYNLTARTDDCTDEILRNLDLYDTWNLWLHFLAWFRDCIGKASEDMVATCLCLGKSTLENLV